MLESDPLPDCVQNRLDLLSCSIGGVLGLKGLRDPRGLGQLASLCVGNRQHFQDFRKEQSPCARLLQLQYGQLGAFGRQMKTSNVQWNGWCSWFKRSCLFQCFQATVEQALFKKRIAERLL